MSTKMLNSQWFFFLMIKIWQKNQRFYKMKENVKLVCKKEEKEEEKFEISEL